jgi:hypothetical protein
MICIHICTAMTWRVIASEIHPTCHTPPKNTNATASHDISAHLVDDLSRQPS